MKKILFVYHVSIIGGGSYCLLNILKSIDRTSVIPYVLLCNDGPLVDEIRKLGVEVYFLKDLRTVPYNSSTISLKALINTYHLIYSLKGFKAILRKIDADAVYLNTMMLYPYLRSAKKMQKKTIIHIREHWPKGEHKWQRKQAIEHINKFADYIVAINNYSASMLEERTKDAIIVYDWVDMDTRDDSRTMNDIIGEDSEKLKVFLYTGGLQSIKGAMEVVQTFINHIHDPNARLLAVGLHRPIPGTGFKSYIKRVLEFLRIKSYSRRLFELVDSDKRIICVPSTYMMTSIIKQSYCYLSYFTIPHANLALAESIILNTPVVAAETSESLEYSLDGSLACLYSLNDIDGFISQIEYLNTHYITIKHRLENKSYLIKELFSPSENINKLNSVLKKL